MQIKEMRALRGPNFYSQKPVIFMKLDLGALEERPTDRVQGLRSMIEEMLPTLQQHTCSPGVEGGFFQRVERGTWAGHVAEHIALELQGLAGHRVTFGKTFTLKEKGMYNMVFRYLDEHVGLRAGEMAVEMVRDLFDGKSTEIAPLVEELKTIAQTAQFGPSTQAIIDEARARGIPYLRLNDQSYVQLGQGKFQRRIEATLMDDTSALGVEIAADKGRTKQILSENGIPVPKGHTVRSEEEALETAASLGYPVVVKPLAGNHGRGVSTNIRSEEELKEAYTQARAISAKVVVEKYLEGFDFRLLVINGQFQAAALREPAYVTGNGTDTIQELVDAVNRDPNRGEGHEKALTKVTFGKESVRLLGLKNYNRHSVPEAGEKVYIQSTANLSAGGTAADITDRVHPLNQKMAERVARLIGLNVMGIDLIADYVDQPVREGTAGIVEVNAGPGLRMHLHPSSGMPRNVARPIVDMLFPEGVQHSVPICAVTGTNGKTTTTRMISHILSLNGCIVGMSSTDAVVIDNVPVLTGDYSGPEGTRTIMKDATIDHAVLEIARGGILRRGLGFKECDVGVFLNVSSDHLGYGGIDTLEDLTRLKSTVTESVKKTGYAVFNADDPRVLEASKRTRAKTIYFSKDRKHPALRENLKRGNINVTVRDEAVIIQRPDGISWIAEIMEIPITFEGQAQFNIENALAATAAAYALGISEEQIRAGLVSFSPSVGQSPGRMNMIDIGDCKVLIDYGHNIGAIHATGEFVRNLMPGKKIRMASGVGNRREEDIIAYGKALAQYYDHIVLCDASPRIRKLGETADLVRRGLLEGGFSDEQITIELKEKDATQTALDLAGPGDLLVLQVENIAQVTQDVIDYKRKFTRHTN